MEKNVLHYYIDTNSSRGYVSFYESNFGKLKSVVKLDGYPDLLMTQIISQACAQALGMDQPVELIHNCLDNTLQGIILPGLSAGLLNIPAYLDEAYCLRLQGSAELKEARKEIQNAHQSFAAALKIHDDWEKIYITSMDFEAMDELAEETMVKLLGEHKAEKQGSAADRFFGAATVNGAYDYIQNITGEIPKRYFLKGRPGTGKSTFLKKIAKEAQSRGFDVEIYHCAFDPSSLDLVAVRELGVCIFDSTSPHEYFPERDSDELIDIYSAAVAPGTDENNKDDIAVYGAGYKENVKKATESLSKAKLLYNDYQKALLQSIDPDSRVTAMDRIMAGLFKR